LREIGLPNINLLDDVASANNFDPFSPQRYAEWMEAIDTLPEEELGGWLALMNVSLYQKVNPEVPRGVNYLPIDSRGRFELAPCVQQAETGEAAWQMIEEMISREKEYCTVLESQVEFEQSGINTTGEIIVEKNQPGLVELSVDIENGGWLIMRDVWYPGWKASIDGESVEIYRADYIFRAVPVSSGQHEISFEYRPLSFTIGIIFSMIGLLVIILLAKNTKQVEY